MSVQLLRGDCLELMKGLPVNAVSAVVTDPPYGLGKRMNGGTWGATARESMAWDMETRQEWIDAILALNVPTLIWGGNYHVLPVSRGWLTWLKRDAPPSMAQFEMAWTNRDMNARQLDWTIAATRDRERDQRTTHPTQKPVAVMKWSIEKLGVPQGFTVLDPFMGSGSTGVACVKMGINFIGMELDAGYFNIARERIEAAQQQSAFALEAVQL